MLKRLGQFAKATVLGGLFVLIPLVILGLLVAKALEVANHVAVSLVSAITGVPPAEVHFPMLLACGFLLLCSFLAGLFMLSRLGKRFGCWLDEVLVKSLPMYALIRNLLTGLLGADVEGSIKPGLLKQPDGSDILVYLIEKHDDDRWTVFRPFSPSALSGTVEITPADRVRPLSCRLGDSVTCLNNLGAGLPKLLEKSANTSRTNKSKGDQG